MRLPETERAPVGESVVPMINVVFLLLIFFLLAGTLSPRPPFALEPVRTTLRPPANAPADGLYVSATGSLFFRGRAIALEALAATAGGTGAGGSKPFEVMVDRRLPADALFPVMEALSQSGFTKIRMITQRNNGR